MKNPTPAPVALTVEEARAIAWRAFALTDYARAVYLATPSGEIVVDRAGHVTPATDYDALQWAGFEAQEAQAG